MGNPHQPLRTIRHWQVKPIPIWISTWNKQLFPHQPSFFSLRSSTQSKKEIDIRKFPFSAFQEQIIKHQVDLCDHVQFKIPIRWCWCVRDESPWSLTKHNKIIHTVRFTSLPKKQVYFSSTDIRCHFRRCCDVFAQVTSKIPCKRDSGGNFPSFFFGYEASLMGREGRAW